MAQKSQPQHSSLKVVIITNGNNSQKYIVNRLMDVFGHENIKPVIYSPELKNNTSGRGSIRKRTIRQIVKTVNNRIKGAIIKRIIQSDVSNSENRILGSRFIESWSSIISPRQIVNNVELQELINSEAPEIILALELNFEFLDLELTSEIKYLKLANTGIPNFKLEDSVFHNLYHRDLRKVGSSVIEHDSRDGGIKEVLSSLVSIDSSDSPYSIYYKCVVLGTELLITLLKNPSIKDWDSLNLLAGKNDFSISNTPISVNHKRMIYKDFKNKWLEFELRNTINW